MSLNNTIQDTTFMKKEGVSVKEPWHKDPIICMFVGCAAALLICLAR